VNVRKVSSNRPFALKSGKAVDTTPPSQGTEAEELVRRNAHSTSVRPDGLKWSDEVTANQVLMIPQL
jgi:hypothetical protein